MSKHRVSVIVTTHFRDDMLAECLASLAAQTPPLHEVVVVDDGGNGSARAVVERYGAPFSYIWQPNAGQQSARNHGVRESTGTWIAFLDDDDLWLPCRHARILALADTGQVDLIAGDFTKFGDGWVAPSGVFDEIAALQPDLWDGIRRDPNSDYSIVGSFPTTRLLPTSPFWGATLVMRRDFFDRIGGWNEKLRGIKSEDAEFTFRFIKNGRLGIIWPATMRYRVHPGNDSNSDLLNAVGRNQIWEHILNDNTLTEEDRVAITCTIKTSLHEILWTAFNKREYKLVIDISESIDITTRREKIKIFLSKLFCLYKLFI